MIDHYSVLTLISPLCRPCSLLIFIISDIVISLCVCFIVSAMMDVYDGCYCCPKPSPSDVNQSAMDLDSALSELGMLSTVTDSRKQYLREQELRFRQSSLCPRNRNHSEPSITGAGTPANSPTKGMYRIIHLNSQFVTSLSTGLATFTQPSTSASSSSLSSSPSLPTSSLLRKPIMKNSTACECLDFGEKYRQEELEQDSRAHRLSRLKLSRMKRFRKPYELPWRQSLEKTYGTVTSTYCPMTMSSPYTSVNSTYSHMSCSLSQSQYSSVGTSFFEMVPDKSHADPKISSSNCSTPEKTQHGNSQQACVTRSKSLDDLDVTKLQLAECENQNFIVQRKEIDTVSQHLQDLHVME